MKSEIKLRELEAKLLSENENVISNALNQLRKEKFFEGAIYFLVRLFDKSNSLVIKDIIRSFFTDLKEPAARIEVMSELRKPYSQATKCMLVSSCWQSGMDYSEYSSDFAGNFIYGDYYTALECFTVFGETAKNIPINKRKEIINLLENSEENLTADKKKLNLALIELLK